MTVPELIARVLEQLEGQFYCDLPRRDFKRDEGYLTAAIGTYGWECARRGWEFEAGFIYGELCRLLSSFKRSGTEVTWMPMYLQTAIRRHIGEHAEELAAAARVSGVRRVTARVVEGLAVAKVIVEPSATELVAGVYRDVRRLRRAVAAERRGARAEGKRQGVLL